MCWVQRIIAAYERDEHRREKKTPERGRKAAVNHQILISSDLEGEFPCAALLERTVAAALEAEGVATPCEVDVLITAPR